MRNPTLQLFIPTQSRLGRVPHNVNDGNPVQANHLLKVDETATVAIDEIERGGVVRSVRVRFEEGAPLAPWVRVRRDVEEDGVGRGFENGVGLKGEEHENQRPNPQQKKETTREN